MRSLTVLIVLSGLLTAAFASADRAKGKRSDWADLEEELTAKGIPLDSQSVIKAALASPDSWTRWVAVELLGRRGDAAAKPALAKILANDEDPALQSGAGLALARLGDRTGLPKVVKLMEAVKDPGRKVYLATQLAELGELSGYGAVADAARSGDEHARLLAAGSLVQFLTAGYTPPAPLPLPEALLLQLLEDSSPVVRKETVQALALGANRGVSLKGFLPSLERLAREDADMQVREAAHGVLADRQDVNRDPKKP
jgi:HEAT repeat protein